MYCECNYYYQLWVPSEDVSAYTMLPQQVVSIQSKHNLQISENAC